MRCPSCSTENPERAKFCMECAAVLAVTCAACSAELPAGARFCIQCGASAAADPSAPPAGNGSAAPAARPVTETPDPRSYTPRHLADRILKTRGAVEGERKQVTVLFADVKESMDLAEQVDPETWHGVLDGFFSILSAGVHRFEGTINQYTGDGIMALFGAPIAHEDHAHRALYAGLHLTQELKRYADELRRRHGLSFSVRMGINSGEVIVGKIGDDLRMDYTAQGHTVGLAARVEQLAAPNAVYLTEATAALVSGYFKLRDLGPFTIKGVREPMHVFELEGVGEARTRLDVSRSRGFSRFVGRDAEMKILDDALDRVRAGDSQIVGAIAEAGAGKSRLFYEFLERCRNQGIEILEAHCAAHGQMIPYLPVLELLRGYFGVTELDTEQAAREKIAGRILLLDDKLKEILPHLFDFLGVPDPSRPVPSLEAPERRAMLAEGLRKIIEFGSHDEPMIVVFEDLHWVDGASDTFLSDMIALLPKTRELILVNSRPGYTAEWMDGPLYNEIRLEPLGPEAVATLLRDLLGADATVTGLADKIAGETAGNPFFVEEVVRGLIESGVLEGERGAYRLANPYERIVIPDSVQSLLAARIDRLSEREKSVLATAAVIGKRFGEDLLRQTTEEDDESVAEALQVLGDAGFIDAERIFPEPEYVFHHPITQEVAYRSQLAERRKATHKRVAQALESECCGKADENAALLAHHWDGAGETLPAVQWSRRAAEWAATRDLSEAHRHWDRVRELLDACEDCPESLAVAIAAREALIEIGWKQGQPLERAAELFEEARTLAEKAEDYVALSRLLAAYAMAHLFSGQFDEGLVHLEEAAKVAADADDGELNTLLHGRLAYMSLLAGRLDDSLGYIDHALGLLRSGVTPQKPGQLGSGYDEAWLTGFRALPSMYLGDLSGAERAVEQVTALIGDTSDRPSMCTLHGFGVTLAWFTGDVDAALRHASDQLRLAEELATPTLVSGACDSMNLALAMSGQFDQAVELGERALDVARTTGTLLQSEAVFVANLADACLGAGATDRAVDLAREAAALARSRRTVMFECRALLILSRALLARGASGVEEAASTLAAAMAIVESTRARGYEPFLRLELAKLAELRGDDSAATRERGAAADLFRHAGAAAHARRLDPDGASAASA